ncbi:MAG: GDP-mannose 4,6-dehydratase [Longimicrobiales bacterium]|nr:GDP-mannose 4,6-dehydratase [Longimicrobiales bacterium]
MGERGRETPLILLTDSKLSPNFRSSMSVLVTGAAGFIGSHTVDHLLARGEEVVGLDNFDDFYPRSVKEGNLASARDHDRFTFFEGDIRDAEALGRLPDHVDTIVHLAAKAGVRPSIERPALYADVNLMGTTRLLELAKAREVGSFVFASSSSVYGNNDKIPFSESDPVDHPISPYAATKKAGELLCHAAAHLDGLTMLCLRFFTVYGPRQRPDLAIHKFARLMREVEAIPMFVDGSTYRDYTYFTDVMDGVTKALDWVRAHEGRYEVVNLGESRTVSLSEMIRVLGEELGVEPRIERLPMQPGDVDRTFADIAKARALLGYAPNVEFREGVRKFVGWLD